MTTMTQSTFLPCSPQTLLSSLCVFPSPPSSPVCRVTPALLAQSLIVKAVCVRHCPHRLEARLRWKPSFRSCSDCSDQLQRRESQGDSSSCSAFGVRSRDCQKLTLRCRAMADPSAVEAGGLPAQEFTFTNKNGLRLKGLLVDGGAGSKEVCILCHGFRSSKQSGTLSALSAGLADAGVSTFRFDFTGNGNSEGKFAYGNYWQEVEDLRAAVEFWTSKGSRVVCVAGHSKGGNCVVLYASKYHDVPCVINISGRFALEKGILERFGGQEGLRKLEDEGVLEIKDAAGNIEYQVTKADLRDRLTTNMHAACLAIPESTRLLTIHGTKDEIIPVDDAYQFAQRIPTHKLVLVKDADHGYRGQQSELIKHVLEFLKETSALQESGALQP